MPTLSISAIGGKSRHPPDFMSANNPMQTDRGTKLPRMLLRVISLRFREVARRVGHELGQRRRAAEAIGLALELRTNCAIGWYVFTHCKSHRAHVAVLTGHS